MKFFEKIGAVLWGAAAPRAAASESLLDFLELFEEARRLASEALRAVFFPLFDFVGGEGGGVILGFVMKKKLGETVVEEMRVIIGKVIGAIVANGGTEQAIMVVEEAVVKRALGVDGRRKVGALHLRHALNKLGMSEQRFEIFLNSFEVEVDFFPASLGDGVGVFGGCQVFGRG